MQAPTSARSPPRQVVWSRAASRYVGAPREIEGAPEIRSGGVAGRSCPNVEHSAKRERELRGINSGGSLWLLHERGWVSLKIRVR
jgi:hypothetical protein